jgi:hypothetical protein
LITTGKRSSGRISDRPGCKNLLARISHLRGNIFPIARYPYFAHFVEYSQIVGENSLMGELQSMDVRTPSVAADRLPAWQRTQSYATPTTMPLSCVADDCTANG